MIETQLFRRTPEFRDEPGSGPTACERIENESNKDVDLTVKISNGQNWDLRWVKATLTGGQNTNFPQHGSCHEWLTNPVR